MAQNLAESGVGARVWAEKPQLFLLDNLGTVGLFPREDLSMSRYERIERMVSQQLGDKNSDIAKIWNILAGYGMQVPSIHMSPYKGRVLYEMIKMASLQGMLPGHDYRFEPPEKEFPAQMSFLGRAVDTAANRGIVDIVLRGDSDENFSVEKIGFWKMADKHVKWYELQEAERLHAGDPNIHVFRRES